MSDSAGIRLDRRPDGVGVLTFDTPDSKVNKISSALFTRFGELLDEIENDSGIRAVVLASRKKDSFIAGADLDELVAVETAEEGTAFSRDGQALLDRIASSRKPFVAAIHGAALGGGLEVALSCRYLLASDSPKTVLALPEVQLGLLPGGGGTQRLWRRVGLLQALPLLLTGKRLRAGKAKKLGLVDALTSPGGIAETAARAALQLADGKLKPRRRKKGFVGALVEGPLVRWYVIKKARQQARAKTRGNYPAPDEILDCVARGLSGGIAAGLKRESEGFGRLAAGPESANLIRLFDGMTALKKPEGEAEPRDVDRVAVLGGGFMGTGIAQVSLGKAPVTVKDISADVLRSCAKTVKEGLDRRVRSRALTPFEAERQLASMQLTTEDADLRGADLVIEAVFENLDLKRKILAATEEAIAPDAVFASNTSALPIGDIARDAKHPERVLGMHYFSPVPKMPLLEIVVTERTSAQALATARAFGIRQGKTVIVVQDGPGFYTSRILSPYLAEALHLLREGARIPAVDAALKDFGYPVGPLALLDEVGIDVAAHVASDFGERFADRGLAGDPGFLKLHEAGHSGRKSGRGFYVYEDGGKKKKKTVHEQAYALLDCKPRRDVPKKEMQDRLAFLMANEAVHCLDDGIVASPRDGDVGAILGLGFPPFRGGPFRWLDALGAKAAVERMGELREAHGERFEPAAGLRRRAEAGERFHG